MPCRSGSPHDVLSDGAALDAVVWLWPATEARAVRVIAIATLMNVRNRCFICTSQLSVRRHTVVYLFWHPLRFLWPLSLVVVTSILRSRVLLRTALMCLRL